MPGIDVNVQDQGINSRMPHTTFLDLPVKFIIIMITNFETRSASAWVVTCMRTLNLILYNFRFHHMVWKRFPTALKSFSIFVRKGGKWRKLNFGDGKFFGMSSYIVENFQNDIPDIFNSYIPCWWIIKLNSALSANMRTMILRSKSPDNALTS